MAVATVQTWCNTDAPGKVSPYRLKQKKVTQLPESLKQSSVSSNPSKTRRPGRGSANPPISHVISSYMEDGKVEEALRLFESADVTDTFLWNLMIRGYASNGCYQEAMDLYRLMQQMGVCADNYTYPLLIKACCGLLSLDEGSKIHSGLIKRGLDSDLFSCNSLVTMYAKLGRMELAEQVFDEMPTRDLVSWNALVNGYVSDGDGRNSLLCFAEMKALGIEADKFSMIGALGACSLEIAGRQGKEIHAQVLRRKLEADLMVQTSLVDMYSKSGNMVSAKRLFDGICQRNVVVWNALTGGYVVNNLHHDAYSCLVEMQAEDSMHPDAISLLNLLPACAHLKDHFNGKSIHAFAIKRCFFPHLVLETSLFDFYAQCGDISSATRIFDGMNEKSLVSWNSMIKAFVRTRNNVEAIQLFNELIRESLEQDEITLASVIPAYTELGLLGPSRQIHGHAVKCGYSANTFILNSTMYMYAKCGELDSSQRIFHGMAHKDVVSWNAIIMGYGIHGQGKIALGLFSQLQESGMQPNAVTFISVLLACSSNGLVEEGWKHFNSMKQDYGIDPQIEHYGCMIDLIGRSGDLNSALDLIKRMPMPATARIWGSLLAASRNHQNIEMAEFAAEKVLSLKHDNTGCYVLLSNMYAQAKMWEDVERMNKLMEKEGLERTMGSSTIELGSKTSTFINGDRSHIESHRIHEALRILSRWIEEPLYLYNTKFKPTDIVKKKADLPSCHSVRLAISFGLISTTVGAPILIKKNIRICDDCHRAVKLISRFSKREIIVGDSGMYHHFNMGVCCCGDYW